MAAGGEGGDGRRWTAAVAGTAAAGAALAAGELADAVSDPVPSLVGVVGQAVVRNAPSGVARAAVDALGTADKPVVVAAVVAVALALGAGLGLLARRRPAAGPLAFVAAAGAGVACAAHLPNVSVAGAAVGAALAAITGSAALALLLWAGASVDVSSRLAAPDVHRLGRRPEDDHAGGPLPGSAVSRRRFLAAGSAVGSTAGVAVLGAWGLRAREGDGPPAGARLPAPADPAPDVSAAATALDRVDGIDGLSPLLTPVADFFRIDEALVAPAVDAGRWRLKVTGMVDAPFELTYDEVLAEPLVERVITLSCVSNEVGGPLVGTTRWLGVPLDRLLRRAGVQAGASQVVGRSVDGFTAGFPVEAALDGRDTLVAVGMDGAPLTRIHGYPARLIVPGIYGFLSATKWLREIELTTWEAHECYWVERNWSDRGPVKVQSRIDVPRAYGRVVAGQRPIAGVAWAPGRGIARVEVRVDDGAWRDARLGPAIGKDAWRQWSSSWRATLGPHEIAARATTEDGEVQTPVMHRAFPDGGTGHHVVSVRVVRPADRP